MQNASGVLLALKEDQSRWGCTARARGGGKVTVLAQEGWGTEGRAQGQRAEAFGRAELLSAPTEI